MLALCSKYSMWFFISISPLPVPSCSLLDSLTHSLLLISTDMIHSSLLFMTEPLWARVLSSGFERTSRAVSALTVWRILLVFYAVVHTHARAHAHTRTVYERSKWARVESHNTNERPVTMNSKGRGGLTAEKAIVTPVWFRFCSEGDYRSAECGVWTKWATCNIHKSLQDILWDI